MRRYNFAKEYSPIPGPRNEKIGPFSGERFKEEVLKEQFEKNEPIEIDIDGTTLSFGPSFMSEAFGKTAVEYGEKRFFEIVKVPVEKSEKNRRFKELIDEYVARALERK